MGRTKKQPKCLGVACALGDLTYDQAWDVLHLQERYQWLRRAKRESLALAVELGFLKTARVQAILAATEEYRKKNNSCPEPLTKSQRRAGLPALTVRVTILMGLAILIPIASTGLATGGNVGKMGIAATLAAAIVAAIVYIVPTLRRMEISLVRIVHPLLLTLPMLSLPFCIYQAYHLWGMSTGGVDAAAAGVDWLGWLGAASWLRLLVGGVVFGACWLAYVGLADWRRRQLWAYEARMGILRGLIAQTDQWLAASEEDRRAAPDPAEAILESTVTLLSTNVWARLAGALTFWNRAAGAISVWYLEPDDENRYFITKAYKTSDLPDDGEVRAAFEEVAKGHKTVQMDVEWYEHVAALAKKKDPKNWRKELLETLDRPEHVSLAGYVFTRRIDIASDDAHDCCVFDRTYMDALQGKHRDPKVRRWLDFRSFAAYPVFAGASDSTRPRGVFIAFRNLRRALPCDATDVLYPVVRLLGQVLDHAENHRPTERNHGAEQGAGQSVDRKACPT